MLCRNNWEIDSAKESRSGVLSIESILKDVYDCDYIMIVIGMANVTMQYGKTGGTIYVSKIQWWYRALW